MPHFQLHNAAQKSGGLYLIFNQFLPALGGFATF